MADDASGQLDLNRVTLLPPPWGAPDETGWEQIIELRDNPERIVRPVVVCVHGTFAAADVRHGDEWWQSGSDFAKALGDEKDVDFFQFHWSGANSEYARMQAGIRLWMFLNQLEDLEIPYSILAHSHGGSVVWNAFLFDELWHDPESYSKYNLADSRTHAPKDINDYTTASSSSSLAVPVGIPTTIPWQGDDRYMKFPHLQSWVTVGTPFFSIRGSNPLVKWTMAVATLVVFVVGYFCFGHLNIGIDRQYLLLGWAFTCIVGSTSVAASMRYSARLNDGLRSKETAAWQTFRQRFYPVWSKSDEAIQALKGGVASRAAVMPRFVFVPPKESEQQPRSTKWNRFDSSSSGSGPVFGLMIKFGRLILVALLFLPALLMDLVLSPIGDRFLLWRARKAGFGLDFAGIQCDKVSVCPPSGDPSAYGSIEESHGKDVANLVNPQVLNLVAQARGLLTSASDRGLLEVILGRNEVSVFDLLVHNYYFSDAGIQKIIRSKLKLRSFRPREPHFKGRTKTPGKSTKRK